MITLYYNSGWREAFIHTLILNSWTSLPTTPLRGKRFWHFIQFSGVVGQEFVMNDGAGHWDNPYGGGNYCVPSTRFALFKGKLIPVVDNSDHILLISDLDSTMIGGTQEAARATSRFTRMWLSKYYFNNSFLVYNTGRSLENYLEIHTFGLDFIDPDMLVTCVGSDAYLVNTSQAFEIDPRYQEGFSTEYWDSRLVSTHLDRLFPWLIKPEVDIFPFKVCRYAKIEDFEKNVEALMDLIEDFLDEEYAGRVLKIKVIPCGKGTHKWIDFVHIRGGKSAGVLYAQQKFRISPHKTLVAGDSENDIDMFKGPEMGVVVCNHEDELAHYVVSEQPPNKYISRASYADAIIEALQLLVKRMHET
mmetsp:Transcript_7956/g.15502  ORF Transcript_7956/g.15502 Transcript_7956/m.15502 type:complete len:360 (-) Transcript_7956:1551-2630(-)|eukprot:CAMPEP_0204904802 /NCGR_PEP_ID=MMETSP1397-20131031/5066_1 /ASSEMBLY_ACC=CAM_ASM_000891 /TAXON_ID=49980 /ORGANISM="Climacostomum Climacostomum virens, Strain Stock W-24" /LENGTH=359 /DNA_ID=CAMNT_0052073621 /DNA_START=167 /DNA_END=1246 /DNA_ORIENTATION=-